METIINSLNAIYAWFANFWQLIKDTCKWILDGLILLLQFVFFTIFDGLLTVIESIITCFDLSSLAFNYAANWANLPDQAVWLITALGLPQCITMLGAAYLVRLTLNLIPASLTRV